MTEHCPKTNSQSRRLHWLYGMANLVTSRADSRVDQLLQKWRPWRIDVFMLNLNDSAQGSKRWEFDRCPLPHWH